MTDTPRTNANVMMIIVGEWVHADFARELERDLAAANRSADACLKEIDRLRARLNEALTGE